MKYACCILATKHRNTRRI